MHGSLWRRFVAEFLGTGWLVFAAVGTAVLGLSFGDPPLSMGPTGVALAFGFVLLSLVYAIGYISGCHVNPAVTTGLLVAGRFPFYDAIWYWLAQFSGAVAGGGLLYAIAEGQPDFDIDENGLGSNGFGDNSPGGYNAASAFGMEVIMTTFFVLVVIYSTDKTGFRSLAGVAIGFALAVAHLVAIPVDNASINPARSFGVAVYRGGWALDQYYIFLFGPITGGILAGLSYLIDLFDVKGGDEEEDTTAHEHEEQMHRAGAAPGASGAAVVRSSTPVRSSPRARTPLSGRVAQE